MSGGVWGRTEKPWTPVPAGRAYSLPSDLLVPSLRGKGKDGELKRR